ncbi:MAG: hypothetical protein WD751_05825 [Anaerolineales bacterium]
MMIALAAAAIALPVSVWAEVRGAGTGARAARIALYIALGLVIWLEAGEQAFRGSETSLLGWFILGLAALLVGEVMAALGGRAAPWSLVPIPVMAVCFALGFDVLRPDAYSFVPAVILGAMTLAVAGRTYFMLAGRQGKKAKPGEQLGLLLKIAAEAFLVYAAIFKVIDRGWVIQWAYMAAGGGLLFATGQLWIGWRKLLGRKTVPAWAVAAASQVGILLMVAAAVFVYKEFL